MNLGHLAYPMSCFCDIPISRISEHTAFYGSYGMGMTKEWGLRNNLAPLIYTPPSGAVVDMATFIVKFESEKKGAGVKKLHDQLGDLFFPLIQLMKPLRGNMIIAGKVVERDFYQENEWRYVPTGARFIDESDFDSKRDAGNKEMEKNRLQFNPSDVRYIFVSSDSEIPLIFDFLQHSLGHFSLNDIKILSSRITSLETLAADV
jgi:hypothetical protein